MIDNLDLKATNYKCFGNSPEGFEKIEKLNLIIGRNNTGKSALLDLVGFGTGLDINFEGSKNNQEKSSNLYFSTTILETDVSRVFQKGYSGGPISGDHFVFGSQLIGKKATIKQTYRNESSVISELVNVEGFDKEIPSEHKDKLGNTIKNPFSDRYFKRLVSDRDIRPETEREKELGSNGEGATNLLRSVLHDAEFDRTLVSEQLLNDLNHIFKPELSFSSIFVRKHNTGEFNGMWEVFLEEEGKGLIPLSKSGSGLKTVILVLMNLVMLPQIEKKKPQDYIFGFEELENNLHPSIQRKLLNYVYTKAIEKGFEVFATTHSNVIIDLFEGIKKTQIVHVTQKNNFAKVLTVSSYNEKKGILEDLDIRASNLLQSNVVVWVEGPTDRMYFNRWMELYTNGELREDLHYQCLPYGGRLLSHFEADPDDLTEGIKIFGINRNCIMIIDSDKTKPRGQINKTKKRIKSEVEKIKGHVWVTKGKEIENYIRAKSVENLYGKSGLPEVPQFSPISKYLEKYISKKESSSYTKSKVTFADKIVEHIDLDDLDNLDLKKQLKDIVGKIKRWNSLD